MFSGKISKTDIVQSTGTSTTSVMSQKAISDALSKKADLTNSKQTIRAGVTWTNDIYLGDEAHQISFNNNGDLTYNGDKIMIGSTVSNEVSLVQNIGQSTTSVMSQKAVSDIVDELESQVIYDVTANNDGVTFDSLSALLSDENLSTLIPSTVRHGGMTIRFVQSSDNKYVQYRLMANTFSTTVANWQGVDDKPTPGSENLVKSGGVNNILNLLPKNQSTLTVYAEAEGWSLVGNGYCKPDINSKLVKYAVTPGSVLKLKVSKDNDGVFQFQNNIVVPQGVTTFVVGNPVTTAIDSIIEVPEGATYLIVSQLLSNETNSISEITEWCPKDKDKEIILTGNSGTIVKDISRNQITLNSNGFGVLQNKDGKIKIIGYVGYVEGEDESETYVMRGSLVYTRIVWYIDLDVLKPDIRVSFSKAIKSVTYDGLVNIPTNGYILATSYFETIIPYGLLGLAVVNNETQISSLDTRVSSLENNIILDNKIFNTKLFEPEFYAHLHGRLNSPSGVGQSWYKRFCIVHISDVHQYNNLMEEAISLSQKKADVIINTGDNGLGDLQTTHQQSMDWLNNTVTLVNNTNTSNVRYLENKGNHDVWNINRIDFRNTVGRLIETLSSNFVWGNTDGGYGYVDIDGNLNMGTIRIILLDPFDYPDGDFPSVRTSLSATFSQEQIDWLINILVDAANKGYHVITAMHFSFGDDSLQFNEDKAKPDATFYQDPFMIPDIIDAIQNKTTLNKTYTDSKNIQNITINEDFTNVGNLDYVCHLFGHIHSKNEYWCQKSDGSKMYDILMLGEAALGTYGNALNKVYRNKGTINEIEFSALEIDTIEKTIYRVSYGAYLKYDGSNNVTNRTTIFNYRKQ